MKKPLRITTDFSEEYMTVGTFKNILKNYSESQLYGCLNANICQIENHSLKTPINLEACITIARMIIQKLIGVNDPEAIESLEQYNLRFQHALMYLGYA